VLRVLGYTVETTATGAVSRVDANTNVVGPGHAGSQSFSACEGVTKMIILLSL
jgi:hypothetical protein